jgi:hypothetical protein
MVYRSLASGLGPAQKSSEGDGQGRFGSQVEAGGDRSVGSGGTEVCIEGHLTEGLSFHPQGRISPWP